MYIYIILFSLRCKSFLLSHANFIEIIEMPMPSTFIFFERSPRNTRRFYGYVERKASQRDDFTAIFAKRHVHFIPAEGDAKVFRGGLSCDVPTRHVRGSPTLVSLPLSFSLLLTFPSSLLSSSTEYRVSISLVPRGVPVDLVSGMPRACDVCTCYHT